MNIVNDIYYLVHDIIEGAKNSIIYKKSFNVIFVIYLQKKQNNNNNYISLLSDCPQVMISNLKNKYNNFFQILEEEIDFNSIIKNNINNIFTR